MSEICASNELITPVRPRGVKSMKTKRFQSSVTNVRAEEVSIRNIDLLARGKLVRHIEVTLPLFIAFRPFPLV